MSGPAQNKDRLPSLHEMGIFPPPGPFVFAAPATSSSLSYSPVIQRIAQTVHPMLPVQPSHTYSPFPPGPAFAVCPIHQTLPDAAQPASPADWAPLSLPPLNVLATVAAATLNKENKRPGETLKVPEFPQSPSKIARFERQGDRILPRSNISVAPRSSSRTPLPTSSLPFPALLVAERASGSMSDFIQVLATSTLPTHILKKHVVRANLAFATKTFTQEECLAWQQARDDFFSKHLNSSTRDFDEKFRELIEMERALPPHAPDCFRIKRIDVCGYSECASDLITSLCQLTSLESLHLGRLDTAKGAKLLTKQLPSLRTLSIGSCEHIRDWSAFASSGPLTSLTLCQADIESKHLQYLPKTLQILVFDRCRRINGYSLPDLCVCFPELRSLTLLEATICPNSDLTPLCQLKNLSRLILQSQNHDSFGFTSNQLGQLAKAPALSHLEVGLIAKLHDQARSTLKAIPSMQTILLYTPGKGKGFNQHYLFQRLESWMKKAAGWTVEMKERNREGWMKI